MLRVLLLVTVSSLHLSNDCLGFKIESPEDTANTNLDVVESNTNSRILRICDQTDSISKTYCKCKNNVVSCDFTGYELDNKHKQISSLFMHGSAFPNETARVCMCNAPAKLNLQFEKHFLTCKTRKDGNDCDNKIHRFDLYNLSGSTDLDGGFSNSFNGDLYISKVHIPAIRAFEFGRGNNDLVENVQALKCCSPITLNQRHSKPLLFVDNSTIDLIEPRGINDIHLWKTVIMKNVHFGNILTQGISFTDNSEVNIALIENRFDSVSRFGIHFEHVSSVLMAKNNFSKDCNPEAWDSRSTPEDSKLILLNNSFLNGPILNIEARRILTWSNSFNRWNKDTFKFLTSSKNKNSSVSIKYNIFESSNVKKMSLDFDKANVTIVGNIIGACNCTTTFTPKNKHIEEDVNRCYTGKLTEKSAETCFIASTAVVKECEILSQVDFSGMCNDSKVATQEYPRVGVNSTEAKLDSFFISLIVQEFPEKFHSKIASLVGLPPSQLPEQNDTNSSTPLGSKPTKNIGPDSFRVSNQEGSVIIPLLVTLSIFGLVFMILFLIFQDKHAESYERKRSRSYSIPSILREGFEDKGKNSSCSYTNLVDIQEQLDTK